MSQTEDLSNSQLEKQVQEALQQYNSIKPSNNAPSIASWLLQTFNTHKKKLMNITKQGEMAKLSLERLEAQYQQGKLPLFIQALKAPKALDGCPDLQSLWDRDFKTFQDCLYQSLITEKKERIEKSRNLTVITGLIFNEFMADVLGHNLIITE